MKTYVIMLSKVFPKGHIRQGESTEFREKLLSGSKIHTIRTNYPLWEKRIKEVENGEACISVRQWQDNHFAIIEYWIRKLTPRECFRLMDVPEHLIDRLISAGISNSQLYKLAGNSIVVAVLYHIFRKMFIETAKEYGAPIAHSHETPIIQQLSLF